MSRRAEIEALAASVEAMVGSTADAEAVLLSLASALFPAGPPGRDRLTWSDREAAADHADDSAEAKLKAMEARFRTLVEQIPAVTFMAVLGEGLNEIYVSPHVEQMLGYTQQEWLADPFLWYHRLHPQDRSRWNDEFSRGVRTGGPFRAECRFLARDGRVVWVHGEARVVRDDRGRPLFLQGVAFDITESKRAQEILLNEAVRTAKIEEELAIARRVQTSILPTDLRVDGLEIAAAMRPHSEIGGDYYDVIPGANGCWLAIGDVAGHGLNAGLVMLMVQSALVSLLRGRPFAKPREIVCLLNEVLFDNIRKRLRHDEHVTFTLLRYFRDGRVIFAGAHEDIVIYRRATGRVQLVHPPGTWLGARRAIDLVTVDTMLELEDGDVMVLYTDGVTEAMNAAGRQFDIDSLCRAVERLGEQPADVLRDRLLADVDAWMKDQADDITLLVARYTAPADACGGGLGVSPIENASRLVYPSADGG
jgi:PAS domain S-box-containing protein